MTAPESDVDGAVQRLVDEWHTLQRQRHHGARDLLDAARRLGRLGSASDVDLDQLHDELAAGLRELEQERAALLVLCDRADRLESAAEPFSETWLKRARRQIAHAFDESPERGRDRWLVAVAELLAEWRLDHLRALVETEWDFAPADLQLAGAVRRGVEALLDGEHPGALEALRLLVDHGLAPVGTRIRLLALAARIQLRRGDTRSASALLDEAELLDDGVALVHAVRGEVHAQLGRSDAGQQFSEAVRLAPDEPDAYVGLALLAEADETWDRVRYLYEQAVIVAGSLAVAGPLLAPAPANLHWRLARKLERDGALDDALAALDRAIALGVSGPGRYPEAKAYKHRAELLLALDRPADAGEAFYEAGRRYTSDGELRRAERRLRESIGRAPDDWRARWYLADVLRVGGSDDQLAEADELWEAAYAAERPDEAWAWVYTSKALLDEQRHRSGSPDRAVTWRSTAQLERGVLLAPTSVQAWVQLAHQHRLLGNGAAARGAAARASALADDVDSLTSLVVEALACGQWQLAEQEAQRLLEVDGGRDGLLTRANVCFFSRGPATCREVVDELLADGLDDDVEVRELGAYCHYVLGNDEAARLEYTQIWERRPSVADDPQPQLTAWAGSVIGQLEASRELYELATEGAAADDAGSRTELGQVHLLLGAPEAGEAELTEGIGQLAALDQAAALALELEALRRRLQAQGGAGLDVVDRAMRRLDDRRSALEEQLGADSVAAELRSSDVAPDASEAMELFAARHLAESGDHLAAAESYRRLLDELAIPEAAAGLHRAIVSSVEDTDPVDVPARGSTWVALARSSLEHETELVADVCARSAAAHFAVGDVETGRDELAHLVGAVGGELAAAEALAAVVGEWPATDPWVIDDHVSAALPAAAGVVPSIVLADRLGLGFEAAAAATLPIVDPVVLDLGPGLVPAGRESAVEALVAERCARIFREVAVEVPAIPVVTVDELDARAYRIKLDEVTVAVGSVAEDDATALEGVVDHLDVVLHSVLASFVGALDVRRWLERDGGAVEHADVVERFGSDRALRLEFVWLLRTLLREAVPISDRATILRTIERAGFADVGSLAPVIRRSLGASLVGDRKVVITLPAEVAAAVGDHPAVSGGNGQVAIPRDEAERLVADLRRWIAAEPGADGRVVVCTDRSDLRAPIARLMALAAPGAVVVADEELPG